MIQKGIASPEKNKSRSMTLPVKTRTTAEAFQMLRAGQPIEVATGYYVNEGRAERDLFFMDKTQKLRELARFREEDKAHADSFRNQVATFEAQEKAKQNEGKESNRPVSQ